MAEATRKQVKAFNEAAKNGDTAKILELLAAGVPVETCDERGHTALYQAAARGHVEATRALLEAGADARAARDEDGGGVLQASVFCENPELVRLLLDQGLDVNEADSDGFTPLMAAAYQGDVATARLLVEAGADLHARGKFGLVIKALTAFEWAKRERKKAVVDLLTQAGGPGADPAEAALERFAAVAAEPGYAEAVQRLGTLAGKAPSPWRKAKGVVRATLKLKALAAEYGLALSEQDALLGKLFAEFRRRGYVLALTDGRGEGEPVKVGLYPTAEKYAVLLACETNGENHAHSTIDIITWLRALEKEQPFDLTACGEPFVGGKFTGAVKDAKALAVRMVKFCPSIVDGEVIESAEDVARGLGESGEFLLWWD